MFLGGSALLVGLLFLFRGALLAGCISLLIHDSPIRRTDVLLLLGGDVTSRVDHAVSIYPEVKPDKVLISPAGSAEWMSLRLAKSRGIEEGEILVLAADAVPDSTYEEAHVFLRYCQTESISSVTIVTNLVHTGRTYWIFRKVLPKRIEIRMAGAPEESFCPQRWWESENGVLSVNEESLKWLYYYWKY